MRRDALFSTLLLLVGLAGVPARAQEAVETARPPGAVTAPATGRDVVKLPAPGVQQPRVLFLAEPEYSNEARKRKISGNVKVRLVVDEQGMPQDITVVNGLGYGLDEKAVETVRKSRFRPAMKDGVPVRAEIFVSVNFQFF